jgi:hypothetical protein
MEDVIWTHYLHLTGAYFYLLKNKESKMESYLFHPHHIMKHKDELAGSIRHLKERNAMFISHQQLIQTHEVV